MSNPTTGPNNQLILGNDGHHQQPTHIAEMQTQTTNDATTVPSMLPTPRLQAGQPQRQRSCINQCSPKPCPMVTSGTFPHNNNPGVLNT
jgi:hypothetical protein